MHMIVQFDGGSRGNPGPAAFGAVVLDEHDQLIEAFAEPIGRATNNVAEYRGLIAALQRALELGATSLTVRGDSELIIKQMRGEYRVKHPDMIPLNRQARQLADSFNRIEFTHNLRHHNSVADGLANQALDERRRIVRSADPTTPPPQPPAKRTSLQCNHCNARLTVNIDSPNPGPYTCACGKPLT